MEDRQPRWQKNDPILHEQLNQHSEGVERTNSRQAEENGELRVADTPPAQILDVVGKGEPFWAVLSGATSPYSWTKVVLDAAGAWQTTARTGSTNAYEVNARTGLNGKYARLYPDRINGYRFYAKQCCSTCGGTLTVNVKCSSTNLSGASVTITQGATSFSGTTNGSGNATFTPGASGTWDITVTLTNYATYTSTFTYSCANQTVNVVLAGTANVLTGNVDGCVSTNLSGVSITLTQGATTLGTGTTDASGNYSITFNWSSGVVNITATKTRFANYTDTFTPGSCNASSTRNFTMTPATGYRCLGCGGPMPITETLTNTPPFGNTHTLTYAGGSVQSWDGANLINARVFEDTTGCALNIKTTGDFEMLWTLQSSLGTTCGVGIIHKVCSTFKEGPVLQPATGYGYIGPFGTIGASVTSYTNSPFNLTYSASYTDADGTTFTGTGTITE